MLTARYTKPHDLSLRGTREAYENLLTMLDNETRFVLPLDVPDAVSPAPYDMFLRQIQFAPTDSGALLRIEGDTLVVTGNADAILCFRENIDFVVRDVSETKPYLHLHFEYYEGHPCIDARSIPLVIEVDYLTQVATFVASADLG
jgi:hypothetical protein